MEERLWLKFWEMELFNSIKLQVRMAWKGTIIKNCIYTQAPHEIVDPSNKGVPHIYRFWVQRVSGMSMMYLICRSRNWRSGRKNDYTKLIKDNRIGRCSSKFTILETLRTPVTGPNVPNVAFLRQSLPICVFTD